MIQQYKKILFPTDLSESARACFDHAASLAAHYRAGIVILHVVEGESMETTRSRLSVFLGSAKLRELEEGRGVQAKSARDILIGKRRDAEVIRDALNLFCEDANSGLKDKPPEYQIIVKQGDAVQRILSVAKSEQCDLIVMGHGKYGALEEAVLGSTTKSLLKKCKIPVLIIPIPN